MVERRPIIQPGDTTVVLPTNNEAHNTLPFLASLQPSVSLIVVDASDDQTPDLNSSERNHV